jgi:group II intron reverse transcriptase/maturase
METRSALGIRKEKPAMNGPRKSDGSMVSKKHPNKGTASPRPAEGVERRGPAEGNPRQRTRGRTQSRETLQQELERIRQVAAREERERFTSLWHHVYDIDRLRKAFLGLKRDSAPGVDEQTWGQYVEGLEENLRDLSARLARGAYHAQPVRRVYIPKADGRLRPIGVPALEDKMVQRACVEVLEAIYEEDFLNSSYGFRHGRGQHDALDALFVGITRGKVNWIFDADIRGFYDSISHEWMVRFVEHRIADERVVRHIKKWLKAGVLEDGSWRQVEEGTPQGGSISPLLSNIYLHYVLDLWAEVFRKRIARGSLLVVRYADEFVVGFQHHEDAVLFSEQLRERLRSFGLELHEHKTRLIEFGRYAQERRARRGEGKAETFDFLGFTHICGTTRSGKFTVRRKTIAKRLHRKLSDLKSKLRQRMHDPPRATAKWLASVLQGHFNYYGVPGNYKALATFHPHLVGLWHWALGRRSQKAQVRWTRLSEWVARWLPQPHITHPYPSDRLVVMT